MNTAITIFQRSDLTVSKSPGVDDLIESALSRSALIGKVETSDENEVANGAMLGIKSLISGVEKAHKEGKRDPLKLCQRYDELKREILKPLEEEYARLGDLMADYVKAKLDMDRAAQALRSAEIAKIEADATLEPELKTQAIEAVTSVPAPEKPQGQTVREEWEFDVTNIWDVVRANPGLVEITLRKRETRECIEAIARTGAQPKIPGLRIWKEVKVGVRLDKARTVDV